jgi:hypothetical protein
MTNRIFIQEFAEYYSKNLEENIINWLIEEYAFLLSDKI